MNDLHFSKLKEALEKEDISIWNEFVSELDIQINLSNTNLIGANLSGADLIGANLSGADLSFANLINVDLKNADLRNADVSGADLRNADVSGADVSGANLSFVNLRNVDLSHADLSDVNLKDAKLIGADLSNANLRGANIYGIAKSIFKGSKHFAFQIGEFISIGCYTLKISKWLKRADKIAMKENYTEVEKDEYLEYINECKEKM